MCASGCLHTRLICCTRYRQVFVPPKKAEHPPDFSVHDYALGRFAFIFVTLTMGWPTYLFFNVTGRPYKSHWVNHFDPYSEIFSKRERVEVRRLSACLLAATCG